MPPAAHQVPRVAICGAGISGLTLAGILSNRCGPRMHVTVLERAPADRDQGYGLDLDQHGQEALARAGVYHRYWDISRPHSDAVAMYPMAGGPPLGVMFRPRALMRLFPATFAAQPETNRGALRDVLLEAIGRRGNTTVRFNTGVWGIREAERTSGRVDGGKPITLLGDDGENLGQYDLVVDAMGLHSKIRQLRVNDPVGRHFSGDVMIHGVIQNPEETCSDALLRRFGRFGSIVAFGRGYAMFMQRFGAGPDDNRACLFYMLPKVVAQEFVSGSNEDGIYTAMGIDKPTSRASGIITDPAQLDKVKTWVRRDMGDAWDDTWHEAVRRLDRVTVRGKYTHGDATALDPTVTLPLVCIGDSMRHCGVGGGGTLAMQDAIELSKLLVEDGAFEAPTGAPSKALMDKVRGAEAEMLERKEEFHAQSQRQVAMNARVPELGRGPLTWEDLGMSGVWLWAASAVMPRVGRMMDSLYRWEVARGWGGTGGPSDPVYSNVAKVLSEEAARPDRDAGGSEAGP